MRAGAVSTILRTSSRISSPLIFLAHIANLTRTMKLGTGVVSLPIYHPAQLAAHIALLDHLTKGRLILGIGTGGLGSDFELFGLEDLDHCQAMMLDSISLMQRIWASDPPYDLPGKFWNIGLSKTVWPDLGWGGSCPELCSGRIRHSQFQ